MSFHYFLLSYSTCVISNILSQMKEAVSFSNDGNLGGVGQHCVWHVRVHFKFILSLIYMISIDCYNNISEWLENRIHINAHHPPNNIHISYSQLSTSHCAYTASTRSFPLHVLS